MKSVRIPSFFGLYFSIFGLNTECMRENTDQKSSEYSVSQTSSSGALRGRSQVNTNCFFRCVTFSESTDWLTIFWEEIYVRHKLLTKWTFKNPGWVTEDIKRQSSTDETRICLVLTLRLTGEVYTCAKKSGCAALETQLIIKRRQRTH